MTSRHLATAVLLVGLAGPASNAVAGPLGDKGDFDLTRVTGFHTGSGGEFTVYGFGASLTNAGYGSSVKGIGGFIPSFQTFCIETGETAASAYFVIGTAAVKGGTSTVDPISVGTAWLYSQFAQGTLAGYFAGNRATQAGLLQNAIWWLEQEDGSGLTKDTYRTNPYALAAVQQFQNNIANARVDAGDGYLGVYVLNNFTTAAARDAWATNESLVPKTRTQDFLYYVAPPVTVPDGGMTLALLGGGLLLLGVVRRSMS